MRRAVMCVIAGLAAVASGRRGNHRGSAAPDYEVGPPLTGPASRMEIGFLI
jgi:hypothetical protein